MPQSSIIQPTFKRDEDGAVALELLRRPTSDEILMDVDSPGVDGDEITKRLSASGVLNADIAVTVFSAVTEASQVSGCHAAAMTDWLAKSAKPNKLYETLRRVTFVGRNRPTRAA